MEDEVKPEPEDENGEELDVKTVVVKAIHLDQFEPVQECEDQDIEWLIGLKKTNSHLKRVLHDFENNERKFMFH